MAQFSFVGKIAPIKDTENFKGYEEKVYDSGWMSQKLRFNVIAGDNRHLVEINAGRWKDDSKNSVIYTFSKAEEGKKSEPIQIAWEKRNDPKEIAKVAGYKVFTIDTDTYQHRKELEDNGQDEELEKSNKKRRHFIAGSDFCGFAKKVVESDKVKDMVFRINGNVNYSYSEKNDQYYANYEVTKMYRVNDDTEVSSEMNIDFYFAEGAMDGGDYNETSKAIVSGFTPFYDSNTKKSWFAPISLVLRGETDDKGKKRVAGYERIFSKFEDDEIRKISLVCQKIDGAQKADIKFEDLDEETQDNIVCGLIELEDAIRDAGGQAYGERIQEVRIEKLGRGSSKGSETTAYTLEDCKKKPFKEEEKAVDVSDDYDIFADDEEDI